MFRVRYRYDRNVKKTMALLCVAALSAGLVACKKEAASDVGILSQKETEEGRTPITILVKYAFTINGFEKAVEEEFPDIDIIQVGNYTSNMGTAEYESRLKNDDLTDIVMTWPLDVGREYWEDRLLELSGMDFTSRYNNSMLSGISSNGKLYYVPGPAQVRGIVYNKTLFEENGWEVPSDYAGFVELCKTIEASGIRSIQLGFKNSEVLDTAFTGYNYGGFFSKPKDSKWLADYNKGIGNFSEHFGPALDVFQNMIDEGIWKPSDLDVDYSDREKMLFTRKCAMAEDSVLICRMGYSQTGITDEFALMPFFNPDQGDWARLYMVCYIGLNKHLAEPANKEKYDLVMKLMDYISTPEGQDTLMLDTGAMFSSVKGTAVPDIPEVRDLEKALENGRYAVFPELKNAGEALRTGLAGMVRGDTTKQQVIDMVNAQNLNPTAVAAPRVLGTASESFTLAETGSFITDAMRDYSGCEFALFMDNGKDGKYNGKGVSARFYKGEITETDMTRIMPDLKSGDNGTLSKVTMTGADLIKTLEYSIMVEGKSGWFYYFSGLNMEYDPVAKQGVRIKSIMTQDKKEIDPNATYSVAVMAGSVPEEFLKSQEDMGVTVSEVVTEAIESAETIAPSRDGRFKIPGKK